MESTLLLTLVSATEFQLLHLLFNCSRSHKNLEVCVAALRIKPNLRALTPGHPTVLAVILVFYLILV